MQCVVKWLSERDGNEVGQRVGLYMYESDICISFVWL